MKYETQNANYERTAKSGDFMTMREAMERGGSAHKIEDYSVSPEIKYIVDEFWELKGYVGSADTPIQHHHFSHSLLDRNERGIILKMDKAFRAALSDTRQRNDKILASKRKNG